MHDELITQIVEELRDKIIGRFVGRIFQLGPLSFAIDFGVKGGEYLYISAEPSSPRLYLIKRRMKELEKASIPFTPFLQLFSARLEAARVVEILKDTNDRIVRVIFQSEDSAENDRRSQLVVQLTGRAANLLLVDDADRILATLRAPRGEGQHPGETYLPPPRYSEPLHAESPAVSQAESPSALVDAHFRKLDSAKIFDSHANRLRSRLQQKMKQKHKLRTNLQNDLEAHGDPDQHKRIGDLLLANLGNAVRRGGTVELNDYYAEGAPVISVAIEETSSLQEEAARMFRQYTKSKRAREEIAERVSLLEAEIANLEKENQRLNQIIEARDETALATLDDSSKPGTPVVTKRAEPERIPGVRHYVSSDGYEILVGRGARDNDNLTFRLARPNDLWLHAGDYPGSHVIVRNPTRKEVPQRTMIEAAQLAGKFSQAGDDAKVVIHYTQRKFLSKPKGAAPGLVRMSSFRSITIEPKEAVSRLR